MCNGFPKKKFWLLKRSPTMPFCSVMLLSGSWGRSWRRCVRWASVRTSVHVLSLNTEKKISGCSHTQTLSSVFMFIKRWIICNKKVENSHPPAGLQEPELCSFPACTLPSHVHPGPLQTPVGLLTCDPVHPSSPTPFKAAKAESVGLQNETLRTKEIV